MGGYKKRTRAIGCIVAAAALAAFVFLGGNYIKRRISDAISNYTTEQAMKQERAGNLDDAIKRYSQAINRDPNDPEKYKDRGDVRVRDSVPEGKKPEELLEEYEDILDDYKKADELRETEDAPARPENSIDDLVKSAQHYNSGFKRPRGNNGDDADDEDDEETQEIADLIKSGIEKFRQNDYQGAFSDFDAAVNLDPDNEHSYLATAMLDRAVARVFHMGEICSLNPSQLSGLIDMNAVVGSSIEDAEYALGLDPQNASACQNLGNLWGKRGSFFYNYSQLVGISQADTTNTLQWAREYYLKAMEISMSNNEPVNPDIFCRLGEIENMLGDTYSCNMNRQICIHNFNTDRQEGQNYPSNYSCPIFQADSSGRVQRIEYSVEAGDFVVVQ